MTSVADPAETEADSRRPSRRLRPGPLTIAVLAALLPSVVWVVRTFLFGGDYRFISDHALIELQTHDVFRHAVLLGPFSRFGWNHPGPLLFYALVLPYRLAGSSAAALGLGALLLNTAALVATVALVRRRAGTLPAALVVVAVALVLRTGGVPFGSDAWNPHVALLPFTLFVVLVWETSGGRAWALPATAGVASFLVQTHIGYAGVVGALAAWAVAALAVAMLRDESRPPDERRRTAVRAAGATLLVVSVAWALPVAEQLTHDPGNLREVTSFATSSDDKAGLADAAKVASQQLGGRTEWLFGRHVPEADLEDLTPGGRDPMSALGGIDIADSITFPWLLVALAVATTVAARRGERAIARLGATVLVGIAGAVISTASITGVMFPYLVLYFWVLSALAAVVVVWAAWTELTRSRASAPDAEGRAVHASRAVAVVVSLSLLVGIGGAVAAVRTDHLRDPAITLREVTDQLVATLPEPDRPVLLRSSPNFVALWYKAGLALELTKRGVDVRVEESSTTSFGSYRAVGDRAVATTLVVAVGSEIGNFDGQPRTELVARFDPLPPEQRAEATAALADLRAHYDSGEAVSLRVAKELLENASRYGMSPEIVVFAVRPAPRA